MRRTDPTTQHASHDVRAIRRGNDGVFGALAGVVVAVVLREWLASSAAKTASAAPVPTPPVPPPPSHDRLPRSPRGHAGTQPDGPDEGFYDPRRGATGYSPVVATFGALAVPALVVLFTNLNDIPADRLVLSSGLLVVGIFGSLIGAFGLAAVGAERDGTANLGAVIMFIGVPVAVSMFSVLGAFEVLADVFVPNATKAFVFMEGLGVVFGVYLIAVAVGDAPTLHPLTLTPVEFDKWRAKQWLRSRKMAHQAANKLFALCLLPIAATVARLSGLNIHQSSALINSSIYAGISICFVAATASGQRSRHPSLGNEQISLRRFEAWASVLAVSLFGTYVLMILPVK